MILAIQKYNEHVKEGDFLPWGDPHQASFEVPYSMYGVLTGTWLAST